MTNRLRHSVAPFYLLLCLLLGGSAQGIWANMILQLLGILILAWAALDRRLEELPRPARQLLGIAILGIGLVALQLLPLSDRIWSHLPGRRPIAGDFQLLGMNHVVLPLALTPSGTLTSMLSLIPPLAVFAAIVRLRAHRRLWLVLALMAGAIAGILLGALQVMSSDPRSSHWYLYEDTDYGVATGFFANANHMATLLIITLPFLAASIAAFRRERSDIQGYSAALALAGGGLLVVLVGLAINRSLAGYGLSLPVLAGSALILMKRRSPALKWSALAAGLLLAGSVALLLMSPLQNNGFRADARVSVDTREKILSTTMKATEDFMPLGSGVGSFRRVFALYEDHDHFDPTTFVNHAHNEYAELALETGIPGIAVLILFLLWWGAAAWRAWRQPDTGPYSRAAAIASAAILIHSLVDFPLRTAAISASFAACLALLVIRRRPPESDVSDLWPTRHLSLS